MQVPKKIATFGVTREGNIIDHKRLFKAYILIVDTITTDKVNNFKYKKIAFKISTIGRNPAAKPAGLLCTIRRDQ